MKKIAIIWPIVLVILVIFAVGCKSKASNYEDDPRSRIIGEEGIARPEWMNGPPNSASSELYYVIGTEPGLQTRNAKVNAARNDAAAQLAQWKSAVVMDTMKSYQEEGGTVGNTQALFRFEQATITRSQANVAGFNLETYWIDPNGIYFGLFSYPKENVRNDFQTTLNTFERNEAAAFADFKAQEAFRMLEAQMGTQR